MSAATDRMPVRVNSSWAGSRLLEDIVVKSIAHISCNLCTWSPSPSRDGSFRLTYVNATCLVHKKVERVER